MPHLRIQLECAVRRDFFVDAVAGRFGLDLKATATSEISTEFPDLNEKWTIGAIVGPSGSGKTSVARHVGAKQFYAADPESWPNDKAVISCFKGHKTDDIYHILTAVGFSSPPSWIKPYHVLSNGEKFRCDLARSLMSNDGRVFFDEFTSLVDRNVAKIGSACVAKSLRKGFLPVKQFVAVTCHYDILEWLEPDWIVDMASGTLARGLLRRPAIALEIVRCKHEAWRIFAKHHYLNTQLHRSASCFMALWIGEPVAFLGLLQNMGFKGFYRVSRLVTLPDYQGVGIATHLLEAVAQSYKEQAMRVSISTGHPALIGHFRHSPRWKVMKGGIKLRGNSAQSQLKSDGRERVTSGIRPIGALEYIGD